ncbi:MAG: hypothetical protein COB94_007390 [Gammaproteobacteria bacterium]|nr:hypothetical protein [Gammaproteobacteria bacterium]
MSDKNKVPDGFKTIQPAPLNQAVKDSRSSTKPQGISPKTLAIGLSLSFAVLGAVIVVFFLPNWVENAEPIITQKTNNASLEPVQIPPTVTSIGRTPPPTQNQSTAPNPTTAPPKISPWDQTQQIELRKEAQSYLQNLLEKQKILQKNQAETWAKEDYELALSHARNGDQSYSEGRFSLASEAYQQALEVFSAVVEQIDTVYNKNITQGQNALDVGDATIALNAFATASLFADESDQAQYGLERANKLDQVFAHIEEGNNALDNGQLTAAKHAYQSALELDPETKIATQKLQQTNRLLLEKEFNRHMSAGYAALDKRQFDTASRKFNKALALKPKASDALAALEQTKHQATTAKIASTLKEAKLAEEKEQWQNAMSLYDRTLQLESNLAEAQTGRDRATLQLRQYQRLQTILTAPKRLSDKNVHRETQAYYEQIALVKNPSPILAAQLNDLKNLLRLSETPVEIRLESDGLTDITVFRIGKIGAFDSRVLNLRPGKYVTVGQRDGYRDVRVEFTVSANEGDKVIRIAANEKI